MRFLINLATMTSAVKPQPSTIPSEAFHHFSADLFPGQRFSGLVRQQILNFFARHARGIAPLRRYYGKLVIICISNGQQRAKRQDNCRFGYMRNLVDGPAGTNWYTDKAEPKVFLIFLVRIDKEDRFDIGSDFFSGCVLIILVGTQLDEIQIGPVVASARDQLASTNRTALAVASGVVIVTGFCAAVTAASFVLAKEEICRVSYFDGVKILAMVQNGNFDATTSA